MKRNWKLERAVRAVKKAAKSVMLRTIKVQEYVQVGDKTLSIVTIGKMPSLVPSNKDLQRTQKVLINRFPAAEDLDILMFPVGILATQKLGNDYTMFLLGNTEHGVLPSSQDLNMLRELLVSAIGEVPMQKAGVRSAMSPVPWSKRL